jgi:uncharacterized alpha-E superfamily protein
MARYLERAEHTARLLDVQINLMIERGSDADRRWHRVISALRVKTPPGQESDPQRLIFDPHHPNSIVSAISNARENARQIREHLSSEMWLQLNRLYHDVRQDSPADEEATSLSFLRGVRERCHLFRGLTDGTMSHSEAWSFIQAGASLERSVLLCSLVEAFAPDLTQPDLFEDAGDYLEWVGFLRSCAALEAYARSNPLGVHASSAAEFILLDPEFPHSVRFAVDRLERSLNGIARASHQRRTERLERISGRLRAMLAYSDLPEILRRGLPSFLSAIRVECYTIHDVIYDTYIAYPIETAIEV